MSRVIYKLTDQNMRDGRKLNRICHWRENEHCEGWDTECGHRFVINDGTPRENGMRYCAYCGGRLHVRMAL